MRLKFRDYFNTRKSISLYVGRPKSSDTLGVRTRKNKKRVRSILSFPLFFCTLSPFKLKYTQKIIIQTINVVMLTINYESRQSIKMFHYLFCLHANLPVRVV